MAEPAAPPGHPGHEHETVEELLIEKLSEMIGGWRGALESAVPLVVFAVVWAVRSDLRASLLAAVGSLVVLLVVALVQRADIRFIGYAGLGLAISAFFALRSGRAEDAFLPGMIQNAATLVVFVVANLARWPVLGFLVGAADPERLVEDPTWWRRHRGLVRVAARLGWVLVALYAVRLAVMVPLYLAENTGALAIAKVVLGWPAYLATVTVMGAMLVRGRTPMDEGAEPA